MGRSAVDGSPVGIVHVAERVRAAVFARRPVVALETAILTHGLPSPANVELALSIEAELRAAGVEPATVGVIHGRVTVGLSAGEIESLGGGRGVSPVKAAARDLGWVVSGGLSAGTTVSATLACARVAGIQVFATGGIGGVHRGVEATYDVSADLDQVASTPVVVVSAGCKSVLDIPRTVEALETRGVPVVGWGTDEFPAFFSRESGLRLSWSTTDPTRVAAMYRADRALGRPGGILVANPVPAAHEIPRRLVESWVAEALEQAASDGVSGKDVTPRLLSALVQRSGGATLEANVALVRDNARVAGLIAAALAA